jgi:type IV secretory pathway TraG/TraD family ATPase VirD4
VVGWTGALYLGAGHRGPVFAPPEVGVLVLGPPRSGKSSALVVPNVLAAPGAVVSTSTKPDVAAAAGRWRSRLGPALLFDPSQTFRPPPGTEACGWSPLVAAASWEGSLRVAGSMVAASSIGQHGGDGAHWAERASALLAPLFHAGALGGCSMADVASWVARREVAEAAEVLAGGTPGSPERQLAADSLAGVLASEDRERSAIFSSAAGVLAAYRSPAALESADRQPVDVRGLVRDGGTLFVTAPAAAQALLAPVVVGLLEEVRAAAYERAAADEGTAASERPAVLLALDEVANIAPLPSLPSIAAEGGGQGLLTLACLQDLSQGRVRWGAAAEGFLSLFGRTVVLPGLGDARTLETISLLAGEAERLVRSTTVSAGRRGGGWSVGRSPRTQRSLPAFAVARGEPGRALVLGGGVGPERVGLTPWFATEPWRTMAVGGDDLERLSGSRARAVSRWSRDRAGEGRERGRSQGLGR